ncbi:conserved Plasmodium protein, unknown function [Plasmodium gallinaceum]|uniref:Asparagine-rich protein n=1 Tax=Plasmodium gallinaceum TaxID=5849 RepID=A0A1J1GUN3_PLAGA|nr:conserved Plasmodium protein, unknown function [Plasmodium gallinaceum]CRG94753.1 conserved Plasmodium protein, unknown function [Plasmodium gallinaceum]
MASSQIRQFATLIDQLPCEADDFNLMEKLEDYSKCFESSFRNNNIKNSDSFFPFNSNVNDYISSISNSQLNLNYNNINENNFSNSSFNENGKKSLYSENSNTQKKNSEHENIKNINVININKSESNLCTNNELPKNINKASTYDENNINVNKNQNDTNNDNNSNSLFSLVNNLQNDEKNNYLEKLKNEIEGTTCKYLANKKSSIYKNNLSEIINHNNEYLVDVKYSNNNKSNDNISLYNLNNNVNDETIENRGENIVYRYDNTLSKCVSYNNKKNNLDNSKISSYINNDEENHVNDLLFQYKKKINSREINKENTLNMVNISEQNGNNDENNISSSDNNLNNDNINNNRKILNNNVNLKYSINENSTSDNREFYDMLKKNNNFNKNILLTKKAKVIKLDSNKSLIIFPVNIHEYGEKYIAVNQKDLLEYISSSVEFDNEDISSLKIKIYQKEKELQNIKAAYSMQTTNIHYLINRVIFKECEYEQLKHKSFTLEHEINKLIQEINSLINQSKEGVYMQKFFIDYKCKCILKLQELQPLLGSYYHDIFHYITSCRTLGQLSIWIPAFEIKNDSLESIANHLIKILLNGLGAPFNTSPQYFLSNKYLLKKSISMESEEDTFLNNLAKRKIIDNYLVNNLNSFNTTKENNSHLSNCQSLSLNSESSSIMGTEELFFNSSKFPSMHSVILKNNKNIKKNEKLFNELNRSNTTPELLCIHNESYNFSDVCNGKNNREAFICNSQNEQKYDNLMVDKENFKKRKQPIIDNEEKENEKIRCSNKTVKKRNIENDEEREKEGSINEMKYKLKEMQQSKEYYEEIKLKEILKENQISFENQMEKNLGKEKSKKDDKKDEVNNILEKENNKDDNIHEIYNNTVKKEKKTSKEKEKRKNKENNAIVEMGTTAEIKIINENNGEKVFNEEKNIEKESKKETNIEKDMNRKKSIEHELRKKKSIEYETVKKIKVEQMELVKKKSIEQDTFKKSKIEQQESLKQKTTEEKGKEKYYESKNAKEKEKQNENLKDKCISKNNKKSNDINKKKSFRKELDKIIEEKNESKKKKKCKNEKFFKAKLKKN